MIHPQAIIDPTAKIAEGVQIGPFSIIGANVDIGAGTVIHSHVVVKGPTVIGKNNQIFQFSSVGEDTPDLKYNGEPTRLIIGDNNIIREGVTIHRGTVQDKSETVIGNDNLLMAYTHIGHDSVIGSHCILVNNVALAGHVNVADWAILAGGVNVHQYVSIGAHSFIGVAAFLSHDVPAYVMVAGAPAQPKTINTEGLRRRGFSKQQIFAINKAYKVLYRRGLSLDEAKNELRAMAEQEPAISLMLDSVLSSQRGIIR